MLVNRFSKPVYELLAVKARLSRAVPQDSIGPGQPARSKAARIRRVVEFLRQMPNGVRILLVFGFAVLAGLALSLPLIIELAVEAPISIPGLLWMLLLAYVIFTLTLILQRKQAAWGLSLGLASLSIPLALVLWQGAGLPGALVGVAISGLLFLALRGPGVRAWFNET